MTVNVEESKDFTSELYFMKGGEVIALFEEEESIKECILITELAIKTAGDIKKDSKLEEKGNFWRKDRENSTGNEQLDPRKVEKEEYSSKVMLEAFRSVRSEKHSRKEARDNSEIVRREDSRRVESKVDSQRGEKVYSKKVEREDSGKVILEDFRKVKSKKDSKKEERDDSERVSKEYFRKVKSKEDSQRGERVYSKKVGREDSGSLGSKEERDKITNFKGMEAEYCRSKKIEYSDKLNRENLGSIKSIEDSMIEDRQYSWSKQGENSGTGESKKDFGQVKSQKSKRVKKEDNSRREENMKDSRNPQIEEYFTRNKRKDSWNFERDEDFRSDERKKYPRRKTNKDTIIVERRKDYVRESGEDYTKEEDYKDFKEYSGRVMRETDYGKEKNIEIFARNTADEQKEYFEKDKKNIIQNETDNIFLYLGKEKSVEIISRKERAEYSIRGNRKEMKKEKIKWLEDYYMKDKIEINSMREKYVTDSTNEKNEEGAKIESIKEDSKRWKSEEDLKIDEFVIYINKIKSIEDRVEDSLKLNKIEDSEREIADFRKSQIEGSRIKKDDYYKREVCKDCSNIEFSQEKYRPDMGEEYLRTLDREVISIEESDEYCWKDVKDGIKREVTEDGVKSIETEESYKIDDVKDFGSNWKENYLTKVLNIEDINRNDNEAIFKRRIDNKVCSMEDQEDNFYNGNKLERCLNDDTGRDFVRKKKTGSQDQEVRLLGVIGFINTFIEELSKNRKCLKRKGIANSMIWKQSKYSRTEIIEDTSSSTSFINNYFNNEINKEILFQFTKDVRNEPLIFDLQMSHSDSVVKDILDDCLKNVAVQYKGRQICKKKWEKIELKDIRIMIYKNSTRRSMYKSVHEYYYESNTCAVFAAEFILAISQEQYTILFISDYTLYIWSNPAEFYNNFCKNSQTCIKQIIFDVNEQRINTKNEHYLFLIRIEDAFCYTSMQCTGALNLKQISYTRYPLISMNINLNTMFTIKSTKTAEHNFDTENKQLIRKFENLFLIPNKKFRKSQCRNFCPCRLLRTIFTKWFQTDISKLILSDIFVTYLIDSWIFPKKYKNKTSETLGMSTLVPRNNINNNSGCEILTTMINLNSEMDCKIINISIKSVNMQYLLNILTFLEEIIIKWSENVLFFDDVIPLLLRILNSLKIVLTYISDILNYKRIVEICEACLQNTFSIFRMKENIIEIILQLCSMFNKINTLGKYLSRDRLIPSSLTYSLYKLYCYYKKNESRKDTSQTIISFNSLISSENLDSLFYSSGTDRRIKCIEKKSRCIFSNKISNYSRNEMVTEIFCSSKNANVQIKSFVALFMRSLNLSRIRINYSRTKGESAELRKMSWNDFKCI